MSADLAIERVASNLLLSNMYILKDGNRGIVIDPCADTSLANGFIIDYILLTHEHYDHISGVNAWKNATDAKVVCSTTCSKNIENPKRNLSRFFEYLCETQNWVDDQDLNIIDKNYKCSADIVFRQEFVLEWHGHVINMIEMPGHAAGAIGILVDERYFFSGDNMIPGFPVECRFPGGNQTAWEEITLPLLKELPIDTIVYPGHFDSFDFANWFKEANCG